MFRTIMILSCLVAGVCLVGCFPFGRDAGPKEITLTVDDDGRTIKVPKGSVLIVSLESNPSTGYTWEAVDLNTEILQQVGEKEWTQNPGTERMLGAPGMMRITFKATGKGAARLSLIYHRPWEGDPPAKRFGVEINVR